MGGFIKRSNGVELKDSGVVLEPGDIVREDGKAAYEVKRFDYSAIRL